MESGFFNPDNLPESHTTPYSIILPPPNVTGTLHMGHAEMLAIQDTIIRYKRMRGFKTLWLPGTDHAAIATQSKVEKELVKKEKKNRHDFGREEFLKRVEQFAQDSHDTIVGQLKQLGSSLDWSREAYTLDEQRNLAVRTAFKKMYDMGLIYRGYKVVNWDPKGQTTVSDDEVEHEERTGKLYTFKYSKDFPISIATTRPETKLGDTGVAVHPDDERYQGYIGKEYQIEFAGEKLNIKIIADKEIDPEYGTGAVGVTPAHSMVDSEIAQRHDLPMVQVINEYAKMMVGMEGVKDLKTTVAREAIVKWLEDENLLEKTEDVTQNISKADRSGGIIEPLPKLQWFIGVNKPFILEHSEIEGIRSGQETTIKEIMSTVVKNNQIEIIPDRFEKTYHHWIDGLHDWCISRQIWYGHRIPIWYKEGEIYNGLEAPKGAGWEQDPDTLDTWFSSGLWTFSTLGWPEETPDLKNFHPTDLMETGYDIIFFWVARMILMTGTMMGTIPFKKVYLHGLVRDNKGAKMSKSLGNVIDPRDMIIKYGADATRLSLLIGVTPGNDTNLDESKIKAYKKFANKIWNATRFVLESLEGFDFEKEYTPSKKDKKILDELNEVVKDVTDDIENYRLHLAGEKLYHYFWHTFADKIIEEAKPILMGDDVEAKKSIQYTLLTILTTSLKLLHPFMPFITEEIWGLLPIKNKKMLIIEPWPII